MVKKKGKAVDISRDFILSRPIKKDQETVAKILKALKERDERNSIVKKMEKKKQEAGEKYSTSKYPTKMKPPYNCSIRDENNEIIPKECPCGYVNICVLMKEMRGNK